MNDSTEKMNMLQLSTGRYVEEVMMHFSGKRNLEQSLLMDANDEEYLEYFSEAELEEIRNISPYYSKIFK
ncbi:hypothetical protein HPULCUR_011972 [Helicostylum pulchrum]|uniref:Uncharacterized protein n=1 Tax=Helicostylum pulchrum TaxID=562976 RepID=A0ABP9YHZ3_9FUNG